MAEANFHGYRNLFMRNGPGCTQAFDPEEEYGEYIREDVAVLVVGAGGLGCEILKDLALSGFKNIHVIDLDQVDISNLNRQFLFRQSDVDQKKYKSQAAADFIMRRCPEVKVTAYTKKIQEFKKGWYKQFQIVIAGLDNVEARSWLNQTLNNIVEFDEKGEVDIDTVIPLIDGGTEGFKGQARVFLPRLTSCFNCSLDSIPPQEVNHSCTIAVTPRIPEHCIAYAKEIMWNYLTALRTADDYDMLPMEIDGNKQPMPEEKDCPVQLDTDNPQHMLWLMKRATERAAEFNITGVTYKLTMQVVKQIIPSVAASNAIISAACVLEAVKILSYSGQILNNFMAYNGVSMAGCALHEYKKSDTCTVCKVPEALELKSSTTLGQFMDMMTAQPPEGKYFFTAPSVMMGSKNIFMQLMRNQHQSRLGQTLQELGVENHSALRVEDPGQKSYFVINYVD